MGYKSFLRSVEAAHRKQVREHMQETRRQEREALRMHRELVKRAAQRQKLADKEAAIQEAEDRVQLFESYLNVLVSVHKDCGEAWRWELLASPPPPPAPPSPPTPPSPPSRAAEEAARAHLHSYQPGMMDKLFGGAKREREKRETILRDAIAADKLEHDGKLAMYEAAVRAHKEAIVEYEHGIAETAVLRELADGVLRRDANSFRRALERAQPYAELDAFKTRVEVTEVQPDHIGLMCWLEDDELVPKEELKLAGGKVTEKEMPPGRYWPLYQDHVCSCAIRAARETFAVLPVSRVIVNVVATRVDSSTGHNRPVTFLGISFQRSTLQQLNMDAIDPSDSMKNFPHRMKFKKAAGFEPVDSFSADEQWVST